MSKHLPDLITLAKTEIPVLENDILSATGPYQLRDVCTKLINIVKYLLHDAILDSQPASALPAAAPAPPPPPRPIPVSRPAVAGLPGLPSLGAAAQPARAPAPTVGVPSDVPIQRGVTNVVITPQGTVAVSPSGNRSVLPPGEAVPLEATADVPPSPPEAPEGVENIVLPPGGGMTPELAAALAGRSHDEPAQ